MGWRGRMVLLVAVTGLSCTSTYQVRNAPASGFLGDYSQLERGGRGRPLLIYRDPAADFTAYKRIQIDPVAGYIGAHSRLQKIAPEDRQALLDYFHATLRKRLTEDYELVNEPGPGVLRLRNTLWVLLAGKSSGNGLRLLARHPEMIGQSGSPLTKRSVTTK